MVLSSSFSCTMYTLSTLWWVSLSSGELPAEVERMRGRLRAGDLVEDVCDSDAEDAEDGDSERVAAEGRLGMVVRSHECLGHSVNDQEVSEVW
jgi:hypothetical protein